MLKGFCDGRTDICDSRVAFATEKQCATGLNITIFPPRPGLNSQIRIITAVAVGGNVGPIEERDLQLLREVFKKKHDETYGKFHILGGGGQQGAIFHMLSQKILNAQKAILSIFRHFYFFPLCTPPHPPPPSTTIL